MMKTKIQYIANAVKWFDKVNGNTYHSVHIIRARDGKELFCPFEYGYGNQYRFTALKAMSDARWLPVKYRGENTFSYERENDYPIYWQVSSGTKRECVDNGKVGAK